MFRGCDRCDKSYRTTVAGIWYPLVPSAAIILMPAVLLCPACM